MESRKAFMGKIIEVSNVFKSYGKKKVLEKVSFSLEEGKFNTLIGCNGAGKSTTMRLLAGVEKPDTGSVQILGEDPFSFDFTQRPEIFFIHESYQMSFSVNLLEMVKTYKQVFPRFKSAIFNQILKDRKISLKTNFKDLSRGQKMQFLLMLALAARPKVMFLDEITAVIDIEGQRYFLDKLKNYVDEGGTVLITTNILSELNDYTDHLVLIQETKLMVNESVKELQKKFIMLKKSEEHAIFQHPRAAKIRKDYDGKDLYLIPRDVMDEDTMIAKFVIDHPPKLEDILILHFHLKQEQVNDEMVA
jgi:ABC-2 type transport system ATP-binding protein